MRVLVACEYSGKVRDAFMRAGHEAVSCDLLPTESPGIHYQGDVLDILDGWSPVQFSCDCDPNGDGWCLTSDIDLSECKCYGPTMDDVEYKEVNGILLARPIKNPQWDLMIAHPPCTYLTIAAEWAYKEIQTKKLSPDKLYGRARLAAREDAIGFVLRLMNAPIHRICIENPIGVLSSRIRKPDQIIQPYNFGHDASKQTCLWLKNLPPLFPTEFVEPRIVDGKPRWGNQTDSGQNKLPPSKDRWKERSETYSGIAYAMADQWSF